MNDINTIAYSDPWRLLHPIAALMRNIVRINGQHWHDMLYNYPPPPSP